MRKIFIVVFVMAALCLALPSAALAVAVIYGPPEIKFDLPDRNIASMDDPSEYDVNDRPLNENVLTVGFGGKQWKVIGYKPEDGIYSGVLRRGNSPYGGDLPPSTVNSYMTLLLADGSSFGGNVTFHKDSSNSNVYADSNLKDQMEAAYNGISSGLEKNLVLPRTLETGTYNDTDIAYWCDGVQTTVVTDAHFWPLSTREASFVPTSVRMFNDFWWLRSPGYNYYIAAYVDNIGSVLVNGSRVDFTLAARPAFNLNLSSILFTSAAAGGKAGGASPILLAAQTPTGAVKFTMENTTNLALTSVTPTGVSGREITFDYAGATANKTLSAVVRNSSDALRYYGKLDENIAATGTASITVPDDFAAGDKLQIFVEEINGNNETDFASARIPLTFTAAAPPTGLTGNGQITGTDNTMEYSADGGATWIPITGTTVTGLPNGSYLVRVASSGMTLASAPTAVTIAAHNPGNQQTGNGGGGCNSFGVGSLGVLAMLAAYIGRRKR